MGGLGLMFRRRAIQAHPTITEGGYIDFADAEVFSILMAKGVSSDGIGITKDDCSKVSNIDGWFKSNNTITTFNEFKYFIGVSNLNPTNLWNGGAFYNCKGLKSISLPDSIESAYSAFYGCSALTEVTVGATSEISSSMFYGCSSLSAASLPKTILAIYDEAFYQCSQMGIVVNMPVLQEIGVKAFAFSGIVGIADLGKIAILKNEKKGQWYGVFHQCASLRFAILPSTLQSIEGVMFKNCTSLQGIVMKGTTPASIASDAFGSFNNCPIYVPSAAVDAYKSAWTSVASRIQDIANLPSTNPSLYSEIKQYL